MVINPSIFMNPTTLSSEGTVGFFRKYCTPVNPASSAPTRRNTTERFSFISDSDRLYRCQRAAPGRPEVQKDAETSQA